MVKLSNVPVTIALIEPWALQNGAVAGLLYSTTYGVFYIDTNSGNASNQIFTIQRAYGGLPGPYNPNAAQVGYAYSPVTGLFTSGLA